MAVLPFLEAQKETYRQDFFPQDVEVHKVIPPEMFASLLETKY